MGVTTNALLSLILCLLVICIEVRAERFRCVRTKNCTCSSIQSRYEFQCPFDEPKLIFNVKPKEILEFQCFNFVQWDLSFLPDLQVGDVDYLIFRFCPLPDNFQIIKDKFGINKVKVFQFLLSNDFENRNLTRKLFEGLSGIEKLRLNGNNIHFIDEDAFDDMHDLKQLEMRSNDIVLLPGLFKNLKKLQWLDLSENPLKTIPEGLFNNLEELVYLSLSRNNLTYISGNELKNLKSLKSLILWFNDFDVLDPNMLVHLKNLTELDFLGNKLTSIPEGLFSENKNLEQLRLNRNPNLVSLPERLLSNLPNLKNVFLDENAFLTLPSNLFENSTRISNISLQNNKLTELPENIFRGLSKVEKILLDKNKLEELPEGLFHGMPELKELRLNGNQLTFIMPYTFSTLKKLHSLRLDNNLLENITEDLFYDLQNLKEINLEKNLIHTIDLKTFQKNENIEVILLGHNKLTLEEFEALNISPFNFCIKMKKLDMSHNFIKYFSNDWILNQLNLEEINVSHNQIEFISYEDLQKVGQNKVEIDLSYNMIEVVDLRYLEIIAKNEYTLDAVSYREDFTPIVYLKGNPIKCDCDAYTLIRYFEGSMDPRTKILIDISPDNVTCGSPPMFANTSVSKLQSKMLTCDLGQYLQDNTTCPDGCHCSLRVWDMAVIYNCSFRNLSRVPRISVPSAEIPFQQIEVHLEGNSLVEGPGKDIGYENVTKLYLSQNDIRSLKWLPPKIELLHLDHNNISFLDYNVLSQMNSTDLKEISLDHNPWRCDCLAVNLSNFLKKQLFKKQVDTSNITCKNSGKLLVSLNKKDLCPTYLTLILSCSITLLVLLLIIVTLVALYYRYQQEIKIWLFAHNMCLWFVTEDEIDKDKQYDAFISYSHKDEDFVADKLLPNLEDGPHPYKLCLHFRNWIPGEFITKQIISSVENSRRTIVILSKNFLESVWGKMEFRTAHTQAMSEGRARVIIILLGELDLDSIDDELKAYLRTNTYLQWGDPWFWNKLRYALPHSHKMDKRMQRNNNIMISINDKLDLINTPTTPNPGSTPPVASLDPLLIKRSPLDFTNNDVKSTPLSVESCAA